MPRKTRSSLLETRAARLRLAPRRRPYFQIVSAGISVGYRRLEAGAAGSWSVRCADGAGSSWLKRVGIADDTENSNGCTILDFWQAVDAARKLARAGDGQAGDKPISVGEALDAYGDDLKARGADAGNASRLRHNVPASLAAKLVTALTTRDLRDWRNRLVRDGLKPATANRTLKVLKATLVLAAKDDPRIGNGNAWRDLERLPDAETARNVVLSDDVIRQLVAAAYAMEPAFGLLIETLAVTGARASQILRVEVGDLEDDGPDPRLLVPSSRKGRNRKVTREALPISPTLARALRVAAAGRSATEELLARGGGRGWPKQIGEMFLEAAAAVGLKREVTTYSLRHSSVTRMLKAGTPLALVASAHDTSPAMIRAHYARSIVDNSDALLRRAMFDAGASTAPNVIPLGRKS
jgi:integrase